MENSKKWQRAELLIFTIFTIINMLPYVATRFFPSMDGASHLSNSNIINQLIIHHNDLFRQFFMINPEPVPNWTSHFLISLFTLIMPAFLAEKILIIILLTATPFSFRTLLQTIAPKHTLFSFLVFPFTHSMFLFFGFFNFCMAILLFLITLNFWIRNDRHAWHVKQIIILAVLVALTYFSHIVVFGILLIAIALHIITGAIVTLICTKDEKSVILWQFLKKTFSIFMAAFIPIVLFIYFFYSRPGIREIAYIGKHELLNFLITARPLISFNASHEGKFTTILFFVPVILAGIGLVAFFMRLARKLNRKNVPGNDHNAHLLPGFNFWWLLACMTVLLAMYFKLPDAYGTASYTNLRIGYVFFLFSILWISTLRIPWQFGILVAIAGIFTNTMLNRFYVPTIRELGKLAVDCNKAAEHVAPNSLILPIYCMDNWFTGHFVDYIAVDEPIIMVYNYECQSGYFPVKWNEKLKPNYYLGNPSNPEKFINFELTKGNPSRRLDYVFIVGHYDPNKDWFFSTMHKILSQDFVKEYEAENCTLYRNKLSNPR